MLKYIFKRLLILIIAIAGCTFMVYMIMFTPMFTPEDLSRYIWMDRPSTIDWYRERGLLDPAWTQYLRYMEGFLTGDFGSSFRNNVSITEEIMTRIPYTLRLSLAALSFSLLLAVPVGIIAAVKRNTWVDRLSMFIALIGISIPVMWAGILLVLFFSPYLGWLPSTGALQWNSVILPGITLGYTMLFAVILTARSSMLEVINKDYIKMARAKGLSGGKVICKHALPNIIIPVLESLKAYLGIFFAGLIITEYLFAWPGFGRFLIQSIAARDNPAILACLMVFIFFFSLTNFVIDIIKAFADPVVRRGRVC